MKAIANLARQLAAMSSTDLNAIAAGDKTISQVIREERRTTLERNLTLPDAKYRVLYGDPPWSYNDTADAGAVQSTGAAHKYPTMSIEELCDLLEGCGRFRRNRATR